MNNSTFPQSVVFYKLKKKERNRKKNRRDLKSFSIETLRRFGMEKLTENILVERDPVSRSLCVQTSIDQGVAIKCHRLLLSVRPLENKFHKEAEWCDKNLLKLTTSKKKKEI